MAALALSSLLAAMYTLAFLDSNAYTRSDTRKEWDG